MRTMPVGGAATLLVLATILAGCGSSPPTQWVTLTPAPASGRLAGDTAPPIAVGRVDLPPELGRNNLVRRARDNSLDVASTVRWPAPLDVLVQHTLARNLAERLPEGRVVLPGQPDPAGPLWVVVVNLTAFSAGPDDQVALDGRWTLVDSATQKPIATHPVRISVPAASAKPDDIAGAMSTAIGRLADQLARSLPGAAPPGGA